MICVAFAAGWLSIFHLFLSLIFFSLSPPPSPPPPSPPCSRSNPGCAYFTYMEEGGVCVLTGKGMGAPIKKEEYGVTSGPRTCARESSCHIMVGGGWWSGEMTNLEVTKRATQPTIGGHTSGTVTHHPSPSNPSLNSSCVFFFFFHISESVHGGVRIHLPVPRPVQAHGTSGEGSVE